MSTYLISYVKSFPHPQIKGENFEEPWEITIGASSPSHAKRIAEELCTHIIQNLAKGNDIYLNSVEFICA